MGDIVILTGAGISAESGIATFRASDGLWNNHKIEDVATPEGYAKNAMLVHEFYNGRRAELLNGIVQPNPAHTALARLQKEYKGGKVTIITQNVDDLHERAGAEVLHMHGELLKSRCTACGEIAEVRANLTVDTECASCGARGSVRPHIVWFGEAILHDKELLSALYYLKNGDTFAAIGTSGNVWPAAGWAQQARRYGAKTVELNLQATSITEDFHEVICGEAGQVVPAWVDMILGEKNG